MCQANWFADSNPFSRYPKQQDQLAHTRRIAGGGGGFAWTPNVCTATSRKNIHVMVTTLYHYSTVWWRWRWDCISVCAVHVRKCTVHVHDTCLVHCMYTWCARTWLQACSGSLSYTTATVLASHSLFIVLYIIIIHVHDHTFQYLYVSDGLVLSKMSVCGRPLIRHSFLGIAVHFHQAEQMGPPPVIYLGRQCDKKVAK